MSKQLTLAAPVTLKGKGLHTGLEVTLTLNPAKDNTGYVIKRVDLDAPNEIMAIADNVSSTARSTTLVKGEATITTVEHCLAALYALGIDNCLMECDAPEFPILDGSAKLYVEAIRSVGVVEQATDKEYYVVTSKKVFTSEDGKSTITLLPDEDFTVQAMIGYPSVVLPNQYAVLNDINDFEKEIAPCRTFVFVRELEPLANAGLIKGGDLNNALVIYDEEVEQSTINSIAELLGQEPKMAPALGYINDTPLQFENEAARHKLLDVIGDFALLGSPIKGRIIAEHPGHAFNTHVAKLVRKQKSVAPVIAQEAVPVMDINQIKQLLPHRYPFLLVDKVMEMTDNTIITVKNVTFNEMHFIGHFPDEPVMPGVLQVEAIAQSIGILVLSQVDDPKNYSTYFLKIDNVKFRAKVVPGDTIVMRVQLVTPVRRGLANVRGECFVNGKVVTEAEMTAQIIKNK
ncbi:MAG: bifunctional UDP-3-O-[3-hydroxymyristoyl] N-acetylglucosamine deacetylase/3-hydroxyacyl-ACP dehydratase [bacterium]